MTEMHALIYLCTEPEMTGEDLDCLAALRQYSRDAGYTVDHVLLVPYPSGSPQAVKQWDNARQDLAEGRYDVIVVWHAWGVPDIYTKDDLHTGRLLRGPK